MNGIEPPQGYGARTFTGKVLVVIALVSLAAVLWLLVWHALYVLLLVFAGILLAVLLRAMADPLAGWTRMPPWLAVIVVCVALTGAAIGGGAALSGPVGSQVEQLQQQLPQALEAARTELERYGWGRSLIAQATDAWQSRGGDLASQLTGLVSSTLEGLAYLFVILFIGVYLAIQPKLYVEGTVRLLPLDARPRAREVLYAVGGALRWWLLGRLVSMIAVALMTWLGLSLLGMPLALTFGILAGLLDFVPNIGPIVAGLPAVLIALIAGPEQALWVLLMYTAVQQIEGLLITPLAQLEAVDLPPGITIVAQVLMGVLGGILGLALATPLAAAALVVMQTVYREDVLGDPVPARGGLEPEDARKLEPSGEDEDPGPPLQA